MTSSAARAYRCGCYGLSGPRDGRIRDVCCDRHTALAAAVNALLDLVDVVHHLRTGVIRPSEAGWDAVEEAERDGRRRALHLVDQLQRGRGAARA